MALNEDYAGCDSPAYHSLLPGPSSVPLLSCPRSSWGERMSVLGYICSTSLFSEDG